jgi:hypothetical protein
MDPWIKNIIDKRIASSSAKLKADPIAQGVSGFAKELWNLPGDIKRGITAIPGKIGTSIQNALPQRFVSPEPKGGFYPKPTVTPTPTGIPTATPTVTPTRIATPTPQPKRGLFDFLRKPSPTPTASPTPSFTPTPTPNPNPVYEPTVPQNIPKTYYTNRSASMEPALYDAINKVNATPEEKRMLFALATQESGRGYQLSGDSGKSRGAYHINKDYRKNVSDEQAMDPTWSTNYVLEEMRRNMKKGSPLSGSLKSWNSKSVNPRYDKDIPEMATTSSFFKGK